MEDLKKRIVNALRVVMVFVTIAFGGFVTFIIMFMVVVTMGMTTTLMRMSVRTARHHRHGTATKTQLNQ